MENKEIFDNNEFTAKTENTQPEAVQGATSPVQSQDYENIYSSAQTTTEAPAAAESVQSNSSEQTSAAAGVQQQPAMQTPVQPTVQQPAAPQQSTTPQQSYNTPPYAVQNRFTNGNQYQQMPQHYDTNGNPITIPNLEIKLNVFDGRSINGNVSIDYYNNTDVGEAYIHVGDFSLKDSRITNGTIKFCGGNLTFNIVGLS